MKMLIILPILLFTGCSLFTNTYGKDCVKVKKECHKQVLKIDGKDRNVTICTNTSAKYGETPVTGMLGYIKVDN